MDLDRECKQLRGVWRALFKDDHETWMTEQNLIEHLLIDSNHRAGRPSDVITDKQAQAILNHMVSKDFFKRWKKEGAYLYLLTTKGLEFIAPDPPSCCSREPKWI